ncbi:MAG: N-acetylglucosamine-6-phosphate deacetylase [Bacillota bacterium]
MKAYFAKEIITESCSLSNAYLLEDQGKIAGIVQQPAQGVPVVAYEDCAIAPGLIDVHTHGALGYETGFGAKTSLAKWAEYQIAHGVTGFLPSTASIPLERIKTAAQDIRELSLQPGSNILGLHLEGPFFAPGPKIGAQNPQYILKEFTPEFRDFIAGYRDVIKYMAVDPALETAGEIVPFCAGLGIKVAAAHSAILHEDFLNRKAWGFSAITHTFNGMVGLDHRRPGLAYSACMDRDLYSEIICDGYHVSYPMIELFLRLKGYRRAILITDSLPAAGMSPGEYTLGDLKVNVTIDGKITKADGGLAGSTLTLDQAVRNLIYRLELPLHEAIYMASAAPAAMLGIDCFKGSLSPGKDADFIVLDSGLKVVATYIQGRRMFPATIDYI